MHNYKSLFFIGFVSVSILLTACDHRTKHRKLIANNSDYDLLILSGGAEGFVSDSIFVGKHSEVVIYDSERYGNVKSYKSCYISNTPIPAVVIGYNNLHLAIDLSEKSNWKFHTVKKEIEGGGECECRLQIANEHIQ